MQLLSVKIQLACGERSFDELHLQRWLFWARWKHVHSVRERKVQDVDRISSVHGLWSRDVFYRNWSNLVHQLWSRHIFDISRGLSKVGMQRLSIKLQLDRGERSFDQLHLQRRVIGA
jgi:hypothetical protein